MHKRAIHLWRWGLLLALINRIGEWNARRRGAPPPLPVNLDCRHCTMCPNGK